MKKGWIGQDELKFLVISVPWSTPEKCFVFPMRTYISAKEKKKKVESILIESFNLEKEKSNIKKTLLKEHLIETCKFK